MMTARNRRVRTKDKIIIFDVWQRPGNSYMVQRAGISQIFPAKLPLTTLDHIGTIILDHTGTILDLTDPLQPGWRRSEIG